MNGRLWRGVVGAMAIAALGTGCSTSVDARIDTVEESTLVYVDLYEFQVDADRSTVFEGLVTFSVANVGDEPHEFLIIETDFPAGELPIAPDGSYVEDAPGTFIVDEIEALSPGEVVELTLDLPAGHYALICNLIEVGPFGEAMSHYDMGMFADLHVVESSTTR